MSYTLQSKQSNHEINNPDEREKQKVINFRRASFKGFINLNRKNPNPRSCRIWIYLQRLLSAIHSISYTEHTDRHMTLGNLGFGKAVMYESAIQSDQQGNLNETVLKSYCAFILALRSWPWLAQWEKFSSEQKGMGEISLYHKLISWCVLGPLEQPIASVNRTSLQLPWTSTQEKTEAV